MSIRLIKRACLAITAVLALHTGAAQAVPTLWFDEFDPADVTVGPQLDFTHDILRDGFRPGVDTISSAFLNIILADDALFGDLPILGDGQESVSFNFDGTGWTMSNNVGLLDIFDFRLDTLLTDGLLNVSLRATQGDFKFAKSTLLVTGDRAAVSEPMSVALFLAGLLGLGMVSRRKLGV